MSLYLSYFLGFKYKSTLLVSMKFIGSRLTQVHMDHFFHITSGLHSCLNSILDKSSRKSFLFYYLILFYDIVVACQISYLNLYVTCIVYLIWFKYNFDTTSLDLFKSN